LAVRAEPLALIVADHDQRVECRVREDVAETAEGGLGRLVARPGDVRAELAADPRGLRPRQRLELRHACAVAIGVTGAGLPRRAEHRAVRAADSENDVRHGATPVPTGAVTRRPAGAYTVAHPRRARQAVARRGSRR